MLTAITDKEIVVRLVLATILGGFIGLERQFHRRSAGWRTHILVCLGSCLIMLTSLYIFDIYKSQVSLDPARIAAGVVTGIGFLGAGAIIRDREGVKGLTTAASVWLVAGIGLAVGCGFYTAGLVSTVIAVIVLFFFAYIEKAVFSKDAKK
ncbi:MAG: MgtC/SapB family protein [Candidatus Omnitrophota bacterium]